MKYKLKTVLKKYSLMQYLIGIICVIFLISVLYLGITSRNQLSTNYHRTNRLKMSNDESEEKPTKTEMAYARLHGDESYNHTQMIKAKNQNSRFKNVLRYFAYIKVNSYRSSHKVDRIHYSYDAQLLANKRLSQVKSQHGNSYIFHGDTNSTDINVARDMNLPQPSRFSEVVLRGKNTNGNAQNVIDKFINPIVFSTTNSFYVNMDNVMLDGQANGVGIAIDYNRKNKQYTIVYVFNGSPIPKNQVKDAIHKPL